MGTSVTRTRVLLLLLLRLHEPTKPQPRARPPVHGIEPDLVPLPGVGHDDQRARLPSERHRGDDALADFILRQAPRRAEVLRQEALHERQRALRVLRRMRSARGERRRARARARARRVRSHPVATVHISVGRVVTPGARAVAIGTFSTHQRVHVRGALVARDREVIALRRERDGVNRRAVRAPSEFAQRRARRGVEHAHERPFVRRRRQRRAVARELQGRSIQSDGGVEFIGVSWS
eukprot:31260-Pelagococcus_subviridis.AAC.40